MALPTSCFLILATFVSLAAAYSGKVLVVSFDGFRWDYLNNINGLVNFERMAKEGVKVPYMNATFSTVTFPNHYSIATGLYQESHGILLNKMYDPVSKATFYKGSSSDPSVHWFDGGEPFWITAAKQGLRSAVHFWVSGDKEIRGQRPTDHVAFNRSYEWSDQVEDVVRWLSEDDMDVVAVYNNEPDGTGHRHGPYSQQTNDSVKQTDENLGLLLRRLDETGVLSETNVIVTSDHGMAKISYDKVVDLHDYISKDMYEVLIATDVICMVLPKPGQKEAVYERLHGKHAHMNVYYKEDIPEEWHYGKSDRMMPILIVMDLGYQCVENKSDPWYRDAKGSHGYDNTLMEMKPIFLARGPAFKAGYLGEPISNVDIYGLVCHILDIKPAPNNGTLTNVQQFFKTTKSDMINKANSGAARNTMGLLFWLSRFLL